MAASGLPTNLHQLRERLEQEIATAPGGRGYSVSPAIAWMYGKPQTGDFDTELGLVNYGLRFANGDDAPVPPSPQMLDLISATNPEFHNVLPAHLKAPEREVGVREGDFQYLRERREVEFFRNVREQWRTELRQFLSRLRDAPTGLSTLIATNTPKLKDIWAVPRVDRVAGLHFHVLLLRVDSFRSWLVLLLTDKERGFARALRQCELEQCGRFFLVRASGPTGGRPGERYCSPEHMKAAHAATSTSRSQASRKRAKKHK